MGLYEEKDNLQVKGDLDVKGKTTFKGPVEGLPEGDLCDIVVNGQYNGNDTDPQAIANVVPVNYEIVSIHVMQRDIVDSTHTIRNWWKTKTMQGVSPTWTKGAEGIRGDPENNLFNDDDRITLNTPARGFSVIAAANISTYSPYHYVALAKPTLT